MNRDAFISSIRAYAKANGVGFDYDARAGKGGHGRLTVDGRTTTVKSGELKPLYVQVVLKQLGLPKDAV